jgi:hypothetical protein
MRSDEGTLTAVAAPADATSPPNATEAADGDALDPDDVFHLLQNQRRRHVLRYLRAANADTVEMADLAEQVAAWEHGTTTRLLSARQRQRVYIPLYQNHLPKLDREGVIDYEQRRGTVRRLDAADQLDRYLSTASPAAEPEPRWSRYYLATALAGAFLVAGGWADAAPLAVVPDAVVGVVAVAAVAAVAVVHAATDRGA